MEVLTFRLIRIMENAIASYGKPLCPRPRRCHGGSGKMMIVGVTGRLKAFRQTKFYDLFAAAPLIAWFAFCVAQMLPSLGQRVALVRMFLRTDPSVLPATLVLRTVSEISTLAFLALLVVTFAVRYIPQRAALGFYPRFAAVAGTFL